MKVLHTYYAPKELMEECQIFSEDTYEINKDHYKKKRLQGNREKIIEDAYYGKLVEWGVYEYVKSLSVDVTKPDMEVYEQKDKTYGADLMSSSYPIHVKGSPYNKLSDPSWVFQQYDKLVQRPSSLDIIGVGIYYKDTNPVKIEILKFFRAIYAVDYYDELKVKELSESDDPKVALYWRGKFDGKREAWVSRIEDFDFNMLIEMYGKV